uniref:Hexosyltransferase n=1 Tax=Parastrongyloides trichosuri TaxID=131310 RepID=A0A0N4Z5A0_PARTI
MYLIFLFLYIIIITFAINENFNLNNEVWNPRGMNLKCSSFFKNNVKYIRKMKTMRFGEEYIPSNLSMACDDIKKRGIYSSKPFSKEEEDFPIAYARNVHKSYAIIELMLLTSYSPQNHYCFNVDLKNKELLEKVKKLANCFDNVYVGDKQFEMNSSGKGGVKAHYECMIKLINKKWKYLLIAQTDDLLMKTNREIIDILKTLNGYPLFTLHKLPKSWQRYDYNVSWTYKNVNIFKKGDPRRKNNKIMNSNINIHVGFVGSAFPYETIEYIVKKLNIEKFLNMTDKDYYGVDEIVWPTLLLNEHLNVPGRLDPSCIANVMLDGDLIKYVRRYLPKDKGHCKTKVLHHSVCDFGIENLHELKYLPHIYAYRIRPQFDYGAFFCWEEYIYRKMHKNNYIKNIPATYKTHGSAFYASRIDNGGPRKCLLG